MAWPQLRIYRLAAFCCIFLATVSCGGKKSISYPALTTDIARQSAPRRIAVLPFVDRTDHENEADVVRISFYSHFSAKPYEDIELYEVDRQLGAEAVAPDPGVLTKAQIVGLGRRLGADAVIFGEVTRFERFYTGIYSQLCIAAAISIHETKTGRRIWHDEHTTRFHEGGLPFSLYAIPFIAIRSGLNLGETSQIQAIDDLARHLVSRIPVPASAPDGKRAAYEVQAGSFLNEENAANLIDKLRAAGYPAFLRTYRSGFQEFFRVLLGPYANHDEAAAVREKIRRITGADAFIAAVAAPPRGQTSNVE